MDWSNVFSFIIMVGDGMHGRVLVKDENFELIKLFFYSDALKKAGDIQIRPHNYLRRSGINGLL